MMRLVDLKGEVFGRLTVVSKAYNPSDTNAKWNCRCDCGRMIVAYGQDLRRHKVVSCGCWNAEKRTKHGMARTPIHAVWKQMRDRCKNPNNPAYHNYGGRGISVDPKWDDFAVFHEDMGDRPTGGTLERIDNEKGYGPDNCRWATRKEQLNNRRNNRVFEHEDEKWTVAQLAERLGVNYSSLYKRLNRRGLSEVLLRPVQPRVCPHCGKAYSVKET